MTLSRGCVPNYQNAPYSAGTSGCHAKVVLSKIHSHDGPLAKTLSCTTLCAWHNGQVNPAHPPARPGMPSSGLPITVEPVPVDLYPRTAQPNDCAQWMAQKGAQQPTRSRSSHETTMVLLSKFRLVAPWTDPIVVWRGVSFNQVPSFTSPNQED